MELDANKLIDKIGELKGKIGKFAEEAEGFVERAKDSYTQIANISAQTKQDLNDILKSKQLARTYGYTWIGDIKLVWGTGESKTDDSQRFIFVPDGFREDCFTVITELPGVVEKIDQKGFTFNRMDDYNGKRNFTFIAIGN